MVAIPEAKKAPYKRLPKPTEENYAWQFKGACNGVDPELFYLPYNIRGEEKRIQIAEAKAVCAKCPVREQCLEFALAVEEPFGIWGGMSEEERQLLIRRTKRQARKAASAA